MKVICNKRTEACITDYGCNHAVPHEPAVVYFSDNPDDDAPCDSKEGPCEMMYEYVRCIPWED